ncbi:hypothetical protein B566_EDAN012854 [Ephemera danica]|nr:hypothetical protein B566_EDAN012854 [Ephemera danica]
MATTQSTDTAARTNMSDSGLPMLLPIQDSSMVTVDIPQPRDNVTPTSCPETPSGNLGSIGGIRVIISSLRSPSDRAMPPPPSYEEALDPNVGCVACIGLAVVIPGAMVVIGSLYFNECPQENKIPLYLVVGGSITLLNNLLGNFRMQQNDDANHVSVTTRRSPLKAFITTFMFIWFILGSIWVYKEYEPSYDPASPNYCNPTLYLFAFWVITSSYLVLMFISMAICCIAFLAAGLQEQLQET